MTKPHPNPSVSPDDSRPELRPLPEGPLSRYPTLTFLLPLVVFMLVGQLEPAPEQQSETPSGWPLPGGPYPLVYAFKILATCAAILWVLPGYRTFTVRLTLWAPVVGLAGAAIWIGLCQLQWEAAALTYLGLESWLTTRSAYNPFEQLAGYPVGIALFLAVRFFGLVVVVPLIEEFFLRGLVMRAVTSEAWWKLPLNQVGPLGLVVGTTLPVLMHPPSEWLAVLAWFSAVSWFMLRTGSIWDCVLAHATTNLGLGLYVVLFGDWRLM